MLNDLRIIQKDDLENPRWQKRSRGELVFTDHDLVPLKNKTKIYKDFANCPYKFKFIIYVDYNTTYFTEKHEFIRENFSDKINSDEIAVCYTSNFTTKYNYIPMTSWILAHRMTHGLHMQIKPQEDKLFNGINGIIPFSDEKEFNNGSLSACQEILFPVNILFTMRSARFASIHNTLDVFPEALAQYIICGSVKFNRIENWNMKRFDLLINWFGKETKFSHFYDGRLITKSSISILCEKAILWLNSLSTEEKHKVNELIEKCEKETNQSCKEILDSQLGKMIFF